MLQHESLIAQDYEIVNLLFQHVIGNYPAILLIVYSLSQVEQFFLRSHNFSCCVATSTQIQGRGSRKHNTLVCPFHGSPGSFQYHFRKRIYVEELFLVQQELQVSDESATQFSAVFWGQDCLW